MYLVRKQIEKEFADNPRLNAEAVRTLLSANGQNQAKLRYNKFTTKSSANKRRPLLTIKEKINKEKSGMKVPDFSLC